MASAPPPSGMLVSPPQHDIDQESSQNDHQTGQEGTDHPLGPRVNLDRIATSLRQHQVFKVQVALTALPVSSMSTSSSSSSSHVQGSVEEGKNYACSIELRRELPSTAKSLEITSSFPPSLLDHIGHGMALSQSQSHVFNFKRSFTEFLALFLALVQELPGCIPPCHPGISIDTSASINPTLDCAKKQRFLTLILTHPIYAFAACVQEFFASDFEFIFQRHILPTDFLSPIKNGLYSVLQRLPFMKSPTTPTAGSPALSETPAIPTTIPSIVRFQPVQSMSIHSELGNIWNALAKPPLFPSFHEIDIMFERASSDLERLVNHVQQLLRSIERWIGIEKDMASRLGAASIEASKFKLPCFRKLARCLQDSSDLISSRHPFTVQGGAKSNKNSVLIGFDEVAGILRNIGHSDLSELRSDEVEFYRSLFASDLLEFWMDSQSVLQLLYASQYSCLYRVQTLIAYNAACSSTQRKIHAIERLRDAKSVKKEQVDVILEELAVKRRVEAEAKSLFKNASETLRHEYDVFYREHLPLMLKQQLASYALSQLQNAAELLQTIDEFTV